MKELLTLSSSSTTTTNNNKTQLNSHSKRKFNSSTQDIEDLHSTVNESVVSLESNENEFYNELKDCQLLWQRYQSLFEWSDGPLVEAMKMVIFLYWMKLI